MKFDKPKFGTKKWFENYWYHYKWHTIAGIFLLFLVVTFVYDLVTQEKFDAEIALHSTQYISPEQQEVLEVMLENYATDVDGDGIVNVGLTVNMFPADTNGDPQMLIAAQTKFMADLSDGNSMILILDDTTYGLVGEEPFFADLSAISEKATDDGKLYLRDTPAATESLLAPLGDKLFLTMRGEDSHAAAKNDQTRASYQNQKQILEHFANDQK